MNKVKAIVLLDSWYTCNRILKLISDELPNMVLVGAIKSNRLLNKKRIDSYIMTSISRNELRDNHFYELGIQTGTLNNLGNRYSILVSRRLNLLDNKYSIRYILCSELDFTAIEILHHYQNRWRIEVFHRIFKHRFSPEKWRFYGIEQALDDDKSKSVSLICISNLCCLCVMSLGFAVRYTVNQFYKDEIVNSNLGESFISYSLSYVKSILILENDKYEMLAGKL